ncbi:MAG: hypothetical protein SGBAC_012186 [Bacillariaceae sp.]
MSNNPVSTSEPTFVSMDLESSLGIIKDDSPSQEGISDSSLAASQGKNVFQPTSTDDPAVDPTVVVLPMLLDPTRNPMANQKVTRTSATYPFANQQGGMKDESEDENKDEDEDEDALMDESDNNNNDDDDDKTKYNSSSSPQTRSPTFEPIPVSDGAADMSMMMFMQDDETQDVLVNKIGDWPGANSQSPPQYPDGINVVPNDDAWVNLDLTETDVEDEDDLLFMLEEEAKDSDFILENIGDRQSFWNYNE